MIDTETKCINQNCKSLIFKTELIEHTPINANYKKFIVRCNSCKTIVTILPYLETNSLIQILQKDINKIKSRLNIF